MEENKEQVVNSEELKKETVETVNQVKETIKNVDIKKDAKEATGFVSAMFKDPFGKIQEIVKDEKNKYFKTALIFIAVWAIVVFVRALAIRSWSFNILFRNVLSLVKTIVAPALGIVVLSGIIYFMNKDNKKSLVTIITAVTTAKIPKIVAAIASLLTLFSSSASKITSPFSSLCNVISIVLTYFATKTIFEKEGNSDFFKKFVIIEALYYAAYIIIGFLGIYI